MIEYKYTRHIWTKDNDFLWPAERTLAYMALDTVEPLLSSTEAINEYNSLDTPQKKFSHLIARLVDRSVEYCHDTDPGLWDSSLFPYMVSHTKATKTLARLMFIFRHGLYLSEMGRAVALFADSNKRYVMFEENPVRMFLHPRAYTLDGMSATVHSNVFGRHSVEFIPWDGTKGTAWLATDFSFELFTLISMTIERVLFPVQQYNGTHEYNRTNEDGGIHNEPRRIEPRGTQTLRELIEGGA
jgi:hypothetical protein